MGIPMRRGVPGFTFAETLVGILVIALVLAAAAPIARAAVRALDAAARESSRLHRIARAYELFRASCDETFVPPWVAGTEAVERVPGGFRVACLGGDEDRAWTFRADGEALVVEAPGGRLEAPVGRARVEPLIAGGRTVGLGADFESQGRTWTWKGYFGAAGR
jgi:type II secretory pathway pseudopilin PulG